MDIRSCAYAVANLIKAAASNQLKWEPKQTGRAEDQIIIKKII